MVKDKTERPVHPGRVVLAELKARKFSEEWLGEKLGSSFAKKLLYQKVGITEKDAIILASLFGTSVELWVDLQKAYDGWGEKGSGWNVEEER